MRSAIVIAVLLVVVSAAFAQTGEGTGTEVPLGQPAGTPRQISDSGELTQVAPSPATPAQPLVAGRPRTTNPPPPAPPVVIVNVVQQIKVLERQRVTAVWCGNWGEAGKLGQQIRQLKSEVAAADRDAKGDFACGGDGRIAKLLKDWHVASLSDVDAKIAAAKAAETPAVAPAQVVQPAGPAGKRKKMDPNLLLLALVVVVGIVALVVSRRRDRTEVSAVRQVSVATETPLPRPQSLPANEDPGYIAAMRGALGAPATPEGVPSQGFTYTDRSGRTSGWTRWQSPEFFVQPQRSVPAPAPPLAPKPASPEPTVLVIRLESAEKPAPKPTTGEVEEAAAKAEAAKKAAAAKAAAGK
ncbi:MAG: hypothetical protein NTY30_04930 [Candidatus Berkelbacteria bacterium]|nr:hypothetical protein [Candidatus Berkelbacteria bacterium]